MMNINRQDLIWNYAATFIRMASGFLLLPFILKNMSAETVGIWSAFATINSLLFIFDFGFNPSFTRNITYIYSGVDTLQATGLTIPEKVTPTGKSINHVLLAEMIGAMKWHYRRLAILFFVLIASAGTAYLYMLLKNYSHNKSEVYIAWAILVTINTFNLYSFYYDCLLQGKGLVKKSRQIVVISQLAYLLVAIVLLYTGFGLIAITVSQAISVVIVRWLSHRIFFGGADKDLLPPIPAKPVSQAMQKIYPNAFKIGLTGFGIWLSQKAVLIIGSFFLPLQEIASFSITIQVTGIFSMLAGIYNLTYQPKVIQLILQQDTPAIKKIYMKGLLLLVLTFVAGGGVLFFIGDPALHLIGSKTFLLPPGLLALSLLLAFEQTFFLQAANFLTLKNEVPFFRSSLITGIAIVLCTAIAFLLFDPMVSWLIIVPLVIDIAYQSWKWPLQAARSLKLDLADVKLALKPGS